MAYITYSGGGNMVFPSVWQDPKYPKDIAINGMLFDIDTMTPKIGSNVMAYAGDTGIGGLYTWTIVDDDDQYVYGVFQNDALAGQYVNTMSPNYPYVARDIKTDGNIFETGTQDLKLWHYLKCNTAIFGRDFLEHPIRSIGLNTTTNEYIHVYPYLNSTGARRYYDAAPGNMMYQNLTYGTQGAGYGQNLIDPETSSGMLFTSTDNTTVQTGKIKVINYTDDSLLHWTVSTELYGPDNGTPVLIHHLTKSSNGDHFFLASRGQGGVGSGKNVDILRYDNSTNSITIEYASFTNAFDYRQPLSIPSNVVYHQKTGDTSTSKKISYYLRIGSTVIDTSANQFNLIEMDIINNTISKQMCTTTFPTFSTNDDDILTTAYPGSTGPAVMYENRIISDSQDINSQKYVFVFTQGTSAVSTLHDRHYMIFKVDASDPTILTRVNSNPGGYGTWDQILTDSSKNTDSSDRMPWCVAPLNVEHSLMMVYCKHSTHLVKFDTFTETLSEVWMDEDTYFTEVTWLPSGKVITSQYENKFAVGNLVDYHAPRPIQVWAEDLIYNVDIAASSNYVEYAGSDVSNTLTISAYDGSNARVATDLTLKVIGPATFDNGQVMKTVTTSSSAGVTETITIVDSGHVEVEVLEIQS